MLTQILLFSIIALMTIPSLLGLLLIYHVLIRSKRSPADSSNRINHLRLVWFALTREELFVSTFPWMKNDEYENIHKQQ